MNKRRTLILTSIVTFIVVLSTAILVQRKAEIREKSIERTIKKSVKEHLKPIPASKESLSPKDIDSNREAESKNPSEYSTQIERVIELDHKVLPRLEEKREIELLLSNPKLIENSFNIIDKIPISEKTSFVENQKERMDAVFYIVKAMAWSSNPQKEKIVLKAKKYILQDRFDEIADIKIRQSFAADKIEIFSELKENHFDEAVKVEAINQSERNAKLFRFANNFYKLDSKRRLK